MTGDVPGSELVPDPSLGGAPRAEGPTTHHLGVPRPAVRAITLADSPGRTIRQRPVDSGKARRRSRGGCDFPPGL